MRFLVLLALACATPAPTPTATPMPSPIPITETDPDTGTAAATATDTATAADTAAPTASVPTAPPPRGRRARFGTPSEVAFCVEETNRYRRLAQKPPFTRSTLLDDFARTGAKHDHERRSPHEYFNNTRFPGPFSALAQNQIPAWHLDPEASVTTVIRAAIASMWTEGPGGGRHANIVGPFSEVGCAIYLDGESITIVQIFREP